MQQQAIALALRLQFRGREPELALVPAVVCRFDLVFNRFAFPAPRHASLYVARSIANSCSARIDARRSPPGYGCTAAERNRRTLLAFIAFQAADLLPAMWARH